MDCASALLNWYYTKKYYTYWYYTERAEKKQPNYLTLSSVNAKSNAPQRVWVPDWMASSNFSVAWAAYYDDQVYEGCT
jgi:hypothetical protein